MVEVVGGNLSLEVHSLKQPEELERCACLGIERCGGIPSVSSKLAPMVSFLVAAAEIDRNLVDAVDVEDDEVFVAGVRACTRFPGTMAELYPQT